jgi:hypothetical protein
MSHMAKLSFAVFLALAAAGLNMMWLSAKQRPPTFVAAGTDISVGKEITSDALVAVPVPGDAEKLRESLIPYANRAILLGRKAPRDYTRGDIFFQRDIEQPLDPAKFEVLGPFRLISVGERFKQPEAGQDNGGASSAGDNVTIAVSASFDERTRRLLEVIDPNRRPDSAGKGTKIVAVQVIPRNESSSAPAVDDKDVVYQTVSLQDIENVPSVLLAGDDIRFVIPASDSL